MTIFGDTMLTDNYCYRSAPLYYYHQPHLTAVTPPYCQPYEDDEYTFVALTNDKDLHKDDTPLLSPPHTPPSKYQSQCFNQLNKLLNRTQNRNSVIMKVENHQIKRISDELIHSDLDEFICKWENCYWWVFRLFFSFSILIIVYFFHLLKSKSSTFKRAFQIEKVVEIFKNFIISFMFKKMVQVVCSTVGKLINFTF